MKKENEFIGKIKKIWQAYKSDYRHWICLLITLGFAALAVFHFRYAGGRIWESFIDIKNSAVYYANELFELNLQGIITVNNLTAQPFTMPFNLPNTWEEFVILWNKYWEIWATKENFLAYLEWLGNFLYYLSKVLVLLFPFIIIFMAVGNRQQEATEDCSKQTKPYKAFKRLEYWLYMPIKAWIMGFVAFLKENTIYLKTWAWIWAYAFNIITIVIEFVAYYLYFVVSFDFVNLYIQFLKLLMDLSIPIDFIPIIGWTIIVYVALDLYSKHVGYKKLEHNERKNRGFINELGIVTYYYAEMGEGKTTLLTDTALSNEVQLRDDALEVILECDMCFPKFPWFAFEKELKKAYENHEIYDKWSCIRWVANRRRKFEETPCEENIFGYNIKRYPIEHDNKLYVENIWDTLTDYACAYTIYTVQSSLIISNYSIRVDSLFEDLGHFPVWDCDFFRRDSRLLDSFSRHSHILDFDMLRLGKKMLKNNPNRNAFGWGVWVVSEADKEYKNTQELKEVKETADECNQKNDLTHVLWKMSRHACMIRHRNFVRILADMQRVENITANMRQIGNVALIESHDDWKAMLPWYAPYKHIRSLLLKIKEKLDDKFLNGRFYGSDSRLGHYLLEQLRSLIGVWNERVKNIFGTEVMHIELQSGRMDGTAKKKKYYKSFKKDFSKRNGSDCMSSVFSSRAEANFVGLDDMAEYADFIATNDELLSQHSHTQEEMIRLQDEGEEIEMEKIDYKAIEKQLSSTVEFYSKIQDGKVTVSEEMKKATQVTLKELCAVVAEWANGEEKQEIVE